MDSGVMEVDTSDINDKMTNWIADHPNLITYLNLEEVFPTEVIEIPDSFTKKRTAKHEKLINDLKLAYDSHVQKLKPEQYGPLKLRTCLSTFLNNKYSYVCHKIEKIKRKQFDSYSTNVAQILSFFQIDSPEQSSVPPNIIFNFDLISFERDSFIETHNLLALKKLAETYDRMNQNTKQNLIQLSKNKSNQKLIINRVLDSISSIYDDNLSYFPIGQHDHLFEHFFYSPIFPFAKDYNYIIQNYQFHSPNSIISLVLQLAHKVIKFFGLKNSPNDSILFLLIFRCLYNDIYPLRVIPFFNETSQINDPLEKDSSFFNFITQATFAIFEPPEDSPISREENYSPENRASSVVSKDPRFADPIADLSQIIFETNPLDALNSIRKCLRAIEKSSGLLFDLNSLTGIISFDKVFSIFLLVIAGSGIQELFETYTPFITQTLPENMLSLPFQFALTKLQAAETHINSLIEPNNEKK